MSCTNSSTTGKTPNLTRELTTRIVLIKWHLNKQKLYKQKRKKKIRIFSCKVNTGT